MDIKAKHNLIVACSGSVAAIKLVQLLQNIHSTQLFNVKVVLTQASKHFLMEQLDHLRSSYQIIEEDQEWLWTKRGDKVLHIQLRKWAHVLLVAPLSANTLAKISNGLCDNTLTLLVRCWDFLSKNKDGSLRRPILVCPAMNTFMYQNPLTAKQLKIIKEEMGIRVIDPVQKTLICGEKGIGAMASLRDIVQVLVRASGEIDSNNNNL